MDGTKPAVSQTAGSASMPAPTVVPATSAIAPPTEPGACTSARGADDDDDDDGAIDPAPGSAKEQEEEEEDARGDGARFDHSRVIVSLFAFSFVAAEDEEGASSASASASASSRDDAAATRVDAKRRYRSVSASRFRKDGAIATRRARDGARRPREGADVATAARARVVLARAPLERRAARASAIAGARVMPCPGE